MLVNSCKFNQAVNREEQLLENNFRMLVSDDAIEQSELKSTDAQKSEGLNDGQCVSMGNSSKEDSYEEHLKQHKSSFNECAETVCMNEMSEGKPDGFTKKRSKHNDVGQYGYSTKKGGTESENAINLVNKCKKSVGHPDCLLENDGKHIECAEEMQNSCNQKVKRTETFEEKKSTTGEDGKDNVYMYENNGGQLQTCTVTTHEDGMGQLDACAVYVENSPKLGDVFKRNKSLHYNLTEIMGNTCSNTVEEIHAYIDTTDTHIEHDDENVDTCANSKGKDDDFSKSERKYMKHPGGTDQFTGENSYQYDNSTALFDTVQEHNEQPVLMHLCESSAQQSVDPIEHKQTHTEGEDDGDILKCDLCPFRSKYPRQMIIHKANHTGDKPFKCDMCSYSTSQQYYLNMHIQKHVGENHSNVTYVATEHGAPIY